MRIQSVQFQNLNSLKGKQSIDFQTGPLAGVGLFAITGPTGAGKSTILDAITLALFGKAARYNAKPSPPDMLSRGTGEAFAEVSFIIRDRASYRAVWHLARARKKVDGAFQPAKRYIYDADGKELASGATQCDKLIVELAGLTPERFFRSAMLAQGEFSRFLKANDADRAELLESLTSTEIYSEIGKACYRRYDNAKLKMATIRSRLEAIELLSEEEIAELSKSKTDQHARLLDLKQQIVRSQDVIAKANRRQQLQGEQVRLDTRTRELATQEIELKPQFEALRLHSLAQPFLPAIQRIDILQHQKQELQSQLNQMTIREDEHRSSLAKTCKSASDWLKRSTEELDQQRALLLEQRFNLDYRKNSIELWLNVNENRVLLQTQLPDLRTLANEVSQKTRDIDVVASKLKYQEAEVERACARLPQLESELTIAENYVREQLEIHSQCTKAYEDMIANSDLDTLDQKLGQLSEQAKSIEQAGLNQNRLDEILAEVNAIVGELDALKTECEDCEKQIEHQTALLRLAEQAKKSLTANLMQAHRLRSLEEHRAELAEGEPCPLCGATEHPYSSGDFTLPVESDIERELQEVDNDILKIDKKLKTFTKDIAEKSARKSLLSERSQTLTNEQTKLVERMKLFAEKLQVDRIDLESLQRLSDDCHSRHEQVSRDKERLRDMENLATQSQAELNLRLSKQQSKVEQVDELKKQVAVYSKDVADLRAMLVVQTSERNQRYVELTTTVSQWINAENEAIPVEEMISQLDKLVVEYRVRLEDLHSIEIGLRELEQQQLQIKSTEADLKRLDQLCCSARANCSEEVGDEETLAQFDSVDELAARINKAAEEFKAVRSSTENLKRQIQDLDDTVAHTTQESQQRIATTEFASIADLQRAILSDGDHADCCRKRDLLIESRNATNTMLRSIVEELAAIDQSLEGQSIDLAAEASKLSSLEAERDEFSRAIGKLEQRLSDDEQNRARIDRESQEYRSLNQAVETQRILCELIGSADGKKFQKFTQGLMLNYLLNNANRHLSRFSDRYELLRSDDGELQLDICDHHQADARRPIASLSGGETFLVSLALALGLSDLSGSSIQIDSLFIDEGFGTLDPASLEVALSALETLRGENKTIGIISHVELLKERITTQIQVRKLRNGNSEIQIVG